MSADPIEPLVVAGVALAATSDDLYQVAGIALADAPAEALDMLAQMALAELIRARLRLATLYAERAAERTIEPPFVETFDPTQPCPVCGRRHRSRETRPPACMPFRPGEKVQRGGRRYRRWVETTEEGRAYEAAWIKREAEREAERERWDREKWGRLNELLIDYKAELRIEWTRELLDSTIAMPDGTRTTWGAATAEQHQERAEMFRSNAMANAEGAARHLRAVDDLRAAGVVCLDDLVRAAA